MFVRFYSDLLCRGFMYIYVACIILYILMYNSIFIKWRTFRLTVTRRVSLVEQEVYFLPGHSRFLVGDRDTQSLILCVDVVHHCLSFCPFSFKHCKVYPYSNNGFWLPLWYLQTFHIINQAIVLYCFFNFLLLRKINLIQSQWIPFWPF